jgi:transcriptional regulator with XRE-family HTH domain
VSFGENLRLLRDSANKMSQDDVSSALGMTRPMYRQLETGEREPSMAEIKAISELFGVVITSLSDDFAKQAIPTDDVAAGVDKVRYKNLILYLAQEVGARPNVGETVFYKLIYFIETLARLRNGAGIAGESFYKMQYGPVPASFPAITQEMIDANELDRVSGKYFTYMQTKYLPRIQATGLSEDDRKVIDTIIKTLGDKSATELSNLSHMDRPWVDGDNSEFVNLDLISKTDSEWSEKMGRPVQQVA